MSVKRYEHGSRVPGWYEPADPTKDPALVPELDSIEMPAGLREQIEAHMALYPDSRSAALPALEAAQRVHGWCSPEAIDQVAAVMEVTPAYLTAVATFYDMLETHPRPIHDDVYVCTNISCSILGADELFAAMLDAAAGDETIHVSSFECLGACDLAPMASVNGEYIGPLDPLDAPRIVEQLRAGEAVMPEKNLRLRACQDPNSHPEGHNGNDPSSGSH